MVQPKPSIYLGERRRSERVERGRVERPDALRSVGAVELHVACPHDRLCHLIFENRSGQDLTSAKSLSEWMVRWDSQCSYLRS